MEGVQSGFLAVSEERKERLKKKKPRQANEDGSAWVRERRAGGGSASRPAPTLPGAEDRWASAS